jgi:hypothetical protein
LPRRTTAAGATVPTVVGLGVVLVGAAVALDVVGDTADDAVVAPVVDVDTGGAARSEVLQATPTNSNATADADARQLGRQPVTSTLK